ncbi:MAG: LppX_LprAFG lipoprotein [Thermomicrobiales bacterium]
MKRLTRLLAIIVISLLALVGCGSDDESNTPSSDLPDITTVLTTASTRISETQSLAFVLEISGNTTIDDSGTIQLLAARGSLARPNLVDVQFQIQLLGTQTASIRMITAGALSWTTDLITGNWGPAPAEFGYDPAQLFDTQNGLGPIMGKINDAELIGEEDVNDQAAWHVRGSVTSETIESITAGTMKGDSITLDLWIDQQTSDLMQVQLAESKDAGLDDPATWTMNLRDHDKPVTIEPPA